MFFAASSRTAAAFAAGFWNAAAISKDCTLAAEPTTSSFSNEAMEATKGIDRRHETRCAAMGSSLEPTAFRPVFLQLPASLGFCRGGQFRARFLVGGEEGRLGADVQAVKQVKPHLVFGSQ